MGSIHNDISFKGDLARESVRRGLESILSDVMLMPPEFTMRHSALIETDNSIPKQQCNLQPPEISFLILTQRSISFVRLCCVQSVFGTRKIS